MIISISGRMGSGKDAVGKIIQYLDVKSKYNLDCSFDKFITFSASQWQIKKWATTLRKVAAILLGMDEAFLYTDEFKNMVLPREWAKDCSSWMHKDHKQQIYGDIKPEGWELVGDNWYHSNIIPMTGREFLQKLGTDAIRNGLHENAWVNALMSEYKPKVSYQTIVIDMSNENEGYDKIGEPTYTEYPNWIITDTRFPNELEAVKERGGITIRVNRHYNNSTPKPEGLYQYIVNRQHPSETALDHVTDWDYVIENNGTIEELVEKLKPIITKINNNGTDSTARQSTGEVY